MKIAYCLQSTYNSGGMERIVIDKINYLSRLGYEMLLITTNQQNKLPFFKLEASVKSIDLDINYQELHGINIIKKSYFLIKKRKAHRHKLKQLLEAEKPDIVISTFGNEINFLHKIKDGSKKIAEIHFARNYRLLLNQGRIRRHINRYITYRYGEQAEKYDAFVCLTNDDKKNWKGLKNISVIPNFIPRISPVPSKLDNNIAISVGRLNYQKGYDRLLQAWSNVVVTYPYWVLHIYGSGELLNELNLMIKELNLEKNVKIFSPTDQIYQAMLDSSLFILSSRYEGLPMVLLEAMSCGLPIVSYNCPCGPNDLLSNNNGILVDKIEDLSQEIINLISNKEKQITLGNNAYQEAHKYLPSQVMPKWINLFNKLTTDS